MSSGEVGQVGEQLNQVVVVDQKVVEDEEGVTDCPDWLFDSDHPDSYYMPVNHLRYTAPTVVR